MHFLGIHGDGAGLDLRQIQNIADEVQKVGARAMNGAREIHLLRCQVAVRILRQLLSQDENAVERSAQFMRHVREELGLVLRGEREFGRLLLHRAPRLFDFLVLRFDLDVPVGELLRLLFQLFIGLLQFALLHLQSRDAAVHGTGRN